MKQTIRQGIGVVAAFAILLTAACSDDGGVTVSGSVSGSVSATGLSASGLSTSTDDPLVQQAVTAYKAYVTSQIDAMIGATKTFTDAVRANNIPAAKAAYAPSRVAWESIEPIAGLIEEIDGAVDARVDDFEDEEDPDFTGWHRLEYLLWEENTTQGAKEFADKLDADLATLKTEMAGLTLPPATLPIGAAELIEEVSEGKITGEEDRYSKTDLWDFNANVQGSQKLIELLTPALQKADPALLTKINTNFADLNRTLGTLKDGSGWVLFCPENDEYPSPLCTRTTVPQATITQLKAQLGALSENVALTAGALKLK